MRQKLLLTAVLSLLIFAQSHGQNLLINGDFENTLANGGDVINATNRQFDSLMANVHSFGSYHGGGPNGGDPDIIQSNAYCNWPESNKYYVALTGGGTDAIALDVKQPIVAGKKYALSFYDEACYFGIYNVSIGISSNDSTFGTLVYTAPKCVESTWSHRVDTFIAPVSGAYLTVIGLNGYIGSWGQLDNMSLTTIETAPTVALNMPVTTCSNQNTNISYSGSDDTTDLYVWNFGNGNVVSGNGSGPYTVTWSTAGTYYVSLTVTDSIGTTTTIDSITVNAAPSPAFTVDTVIAAGETDLVNYTGNGTPELTTFNWNFSNAIVEKDNIDSSLITWVQPGTYNVGLTVTQDGCSASATPRLIKVSNPLRAATPVCTDSVSMVSCLGFNGIAGSYNWSFSGANIISGSGAGPYTLQYPTPGTYPVSLTVTINNASYTYNDTIVVTSSGFCAGNAQRDTVYSNGNGTSNSDDSATLSTTTGINTTNFTIGTIYPNPTFNNLNVTFSTNTHGTVQLVVYDVLGREIIKNAKTISEGETSMVLNTAELPAGSYFIRLVEGDNYSDAQKFVKLL